MLEFLFLSDLIFPTTGSLGARVGKFRRTKHDSSSRTCYNFYLNQLDSLSTLLEAVQVFRRGVDRKFRGVYKGSSGQQL
jgi:hypothetical protein